MTSLKPPLYSSKAIFLDRDGTLIVEKHYLSNPEAVECEKTVISALHLFRQLGYKLIMVSNQSGIARGYLTFQNYAAVQSRLTLILLKEKLTLDGSYFCPHLPKENDAPCTCRKPHPGMLLQACKDHHLNIKSCIMIGDKDSDCEAGKNAGMPSLLIDTGHGHKATGEAAHQRFPNLLAAAQWVSVSKTIQ